jgi:hypothetical protein
VTSPDVRLHDGGSVRGLGPVQVIGRCSEQIQDRAPLGHHQFPFRRDLFQSYASARSSRRPVWGRSLFRPFIPRPACCPADRLLSEIADPAERAC